MNRQDATTPRCQLRVGICIALHTAWYFIAPWFQSSIGHSDEAAWLPMFMFPSLVVGIVAGVATLIVWKRWLVGLFGLTLVVHIVVGMGFHPR